MSEMSRMARKDMRAKVRRLTSTDPHQKVDASSWTPPEEMRPGHKVYDQSKLRNATAKIYKLGGKVQGDRGPLRRDKRARGGKADGGVPTSRLTENPTTGSKIMGMNKGGSAYATGCEHMKRGGKSGDGFYEGTRPTGGRIARASGGRSKEREAVILKQLRNKEPPDLESYREVAKGINERDQAKMRGERAHGGRTKGKTTININVGGQGNAPPPMPPPQMVTRPPPMPPPMPPGGPPPGGPPMGGPPGGPGGPPIPPQSMGGPPPGRRHGGRAKREKGGMVHMTAGAGGGLGRLEKTRLQAKENRSHS